MSTWTTFWDMHSGGSQKEKYSKIYIEAEEKQAKVIFYNKFGHNPERVSCTCCGGDYSIDESESLASATGYHRNCEWGCTYKNGNEVSKEVALDKESKLNKGYQWAYIEKTSKSNLDIRKKCNTPDDDKWGIHIPLEEYLKRDDVCVIYATDIQPEEIKGEIPEQGYVWVD